MDNRTVINPAVQAAATVVNREIIEEYNRQNGIQPPEGAGLQPGAVLCENYRVVSRLEVTSGEADLYLCEDSEGAKYAAKVYRRERAVKREVVEALARIDSPYVAKIYAMGEEKGCPVEILPYYEKGSLQGRVYQEDELISRVIPSINEGLRVLHEAGIIHKDLKPSNLMLSDDGETVSIIDFGISSVVENDNTVLVTRTGMTPEYSAPETFRGVFLQESDYYSFGVTLFELLCGYTPYANMQPEEIEQYISLQKIPFPDDVSLRMRDLISALTYYDLTNRADKGNPNRRWTYEEVKRWLDGEDQPIPGLGGADAEDMPPYEFCGQAYSEPEALAAALARHWEEGKKHLFRGKLTAHFRRCNQDLARKCQAAEEEAGRTNGRDDVIFWRLIYQIDPKMRKFCWLGQRYESLPAFGRDVLDRLWDKDKSQYSYYNSLLGEKVISQFVAMTAPKSEKLKKAAAAIEDAYELEKNSGADTRRAYYLMAYALSGQKLLLLDGEKFRTTGELAAHMRKTLATSYESFEALCHRLIDYDGNLDFQLESWLMAIGKQAEIERWRESLSE